MSNQKTIRITDNTKAILKKAKKDYDVTSYDKAIYELSKDRLGLKLEDNVIRQLQEQASHTLWDASEYLRITLDIVKSDVKDERRK